MNALIAYYSTTEKGKQSNEDKAVAELEKTLKEKGVFVFYQKWKDGIHFNARTNEGLIDVSALMKECAEGLEDANGGGHKQAAGAKLMEKDLDIFLERVLNSKLFIL
jgi:oligoribonuclease NrnB/cAMP/cGMP phosphodiesterase (DHH superfamily)